MRSMITKGDTTFLEAYQQYGRIINITVTGTSKYSPSVILNYRSAPDVVIWSAVLASSAFPNFLAPIELQVKNPRTHQLEPFHVHGKTFFDGTIKHDIPIKEMAKLWNANYFIVSQVNPHLVPRELQHDRRTKPQTTTRCKPAQPQTQRTVSIVACVCASGVANFSVLRPARRHRSSSRKSGQASRQRQRSAWRLHPRHVREAAQAGDGQMVRHPHHHHHHTHTHTHTHTHPSTDRQTLNASAPGCTMDDSPSHRFTRCVCIAAVSLHVRTCAYVVCRFKFLSDLDLLPTVFGADWRFIYLQKLKGTLTIVPDAPCWAYLRVISDPNYSAMQHYILTGERATVSLQRV